MAKHKAKVASFLFTDENVTVTRPENQQNDRLYAYPSTKKTSSQNVYAHIINVQSLIASVVKQQVVGISFFTPV